MSEPKDILTGHNYDGIQEYDNPTPGWWNWLFIATVLFSVVYFLIVTVIADGRLSPAASHDREQDEAIRLQYGTIANEKPTAVTLLKLMKDDKWVRAGASVFQTQCVACHGRNGEGATGPNLTDDAYINVKKIDDIYDVISKGRNNGAMPAWGPRLQPAELLVVSAYVASIRGKNLPGKPVEPNATVIPPW